jgi:Tol biopolymer transport system component
VLVLAGFLVVDAGGSAQRDQAPKRRVALTREALRPGRALLTYVAANRGICLIRADGKHPVRLTPRWRGLGTPAWSPRGRYVAFKRSADYHGGHPTTAKIAVADARGHVHWTFGAWDKNGSPIWSPDGRHIAYRGTDNDGSNGFAVARPDGSDDHRVLECVSDDCSSAHPSWSADGQRIAFVDWTGPTGPRIVSTRSDGSDRRLLVADAQQPVYSPKEPKLAYTAGSQSAFTTLFVADADGNGPRTIASGVISWPTWSPDGRFLAYLELSPNGVDWEIAVARADGTRAPTVIASHVPRDTYVRAGYIAWSPGGKLVAFVRGPSLVAAGADGRSERVAVFQVGNIESTSDGVSPQAWRPAVALPVAKRPACPRR